MVDQPNDVFAQPEATPPVSVTPQEPNALLTKLQSITREDGTQKYQTVEQAFDALAASQTYINTLETDNKLLAGEAAKIGALEEQLNTLNSKVSTEEKPTENTNPSGGLTAEQAETLFTQRLDERDQLATRRANLAQVNDALANKYGDKAYAAIEAKAAELGMTLDQLKVHASDNPKLILGHFNAVAPASSAPSTNSINLPNVAPTVNEVKLPEKSLLSGAGSNSAAVMDVIAQIRQKVNAEQGIVN